MVFFCMYTDTLYYYDAGFFCVFGRDLSDQRVHTDDCWVFGPNEWDQLSMHNKHSNGMPPRIDASAGRGKSTCEYFLGDIVGKKYS